MSSEPHFYDEGGLSSEAGLKNETSIGVLGNRDQSNA